MAIEGIFYQTLGLLHLGLLICSVQAKAIQVNCSAVTTEEKVGCVVPDPENANATVCYAFGCCWNPTETNSTLRCFTKRGGTCIAYRGKVCSSSLNTTLPTYRHTPRFFDNRFGLRGTEQFLATVLGVINEFAEDDEKCRYIMVNMICHYTLAPCSQNNTAAIEYCKEDCEAIFKECSKAVNQVIGAARLLTAAQGIDFVHVDIPDCSKLNSFEYFEDKPDMTCLKTGFFNYTESVETSTAFPRTTFAADDNKLHIILPLVFVGLVILACVVVFVLRRRRQIAITQNAPITMRDRLRAESLNNLDARLLELSSANKPKQYRLDQVQYVKDLGEGFFGRVFQGLAAGLIDRHPKKEVAVAVKALKDEPSKEQKEEFFREVTLMSILWHPNIVQLLAVSTEEEPYGMVLEFMSNGDLNQYLRNALPAETSLDSSEKEKVYLTQEDLISISVQIAAGMQYLAEIKLVHRDLAARNCLVGDNLMVKIGDFGMSRDIYTSEYYKMSKETRLPIRWLAPETLLYGTFTIKSDVYAYGVLLWEIFTFGLQPYYGYANKEVMDFIQEGYHLTRPANCPDFVYAIMKDCWIREPEKRVGFKTISMQLKNSNHNCDVPPSSEGEEGPAKVEITESDTENCDIPRCPAISDYDIPSATANEGFSDVPRSYEDLRIGSADDKTAEDGNVLSDFPE